MATMALLVLVVSVATLVFMVKTWKMLRDDRKSSGDALVVPRAKAQEQEVKENSGLAAAFGMSDEEVARIARIALAEQGAKP